MADLQVTLAFLLENQAEVARELERTGGIAGADFGKGLSEGARKSLDDLINQATEAAKKVGLIFNKQKFQFETVRGEIVPPEAIKNIAKINKEFKAALSAVQAFKAALSTTSKIDDRSIAGLSKKLADLQNRQLTINVDSKEFDDLQREIDAVNKDLSKIQSRRVLIDADAESILAVVNNLQEKLDQLRQRRLKVNVNSEEFTRLTQEIAATEKNIKEIESNQILVDFDKNSLQGLQNRLSELQTKQTKVSVNSADFIQLQKEIDKVKTEITEANKSLLTLNVDPKSIQALNSRLSELQTRQTKVNVDSTDFIELQREIDRIKSQIAEASKNLITINVDPKSIQALSSKLSELQTKQTKVSVDSEEFKELQKEISDIENDIAQASKTRLFVDVDPKSVQALSSKLNELQTRQTKLNIDSREFKDLEIEIDNLQKEIDGIRQKKLLLNVDSNSVTALTTKLESQIRDLRQRRLVISVDSSEFKTLSNEINKSERELRRLQQTVKDFDEFNILESAITGASISLTNQITDALLTTLRSVRNLVGGFLELDSEIRLAAAAAGEQGGYQKLSNVIEKVGIDAAGTSKQVAELATSLVRAGFTVDEVSKALPGVVRGAEATGTGFQQFGEIVGNTLRGFGIDVKETSRVVDVLTNAANSSNASIEGLGYTFQYAAPIAKALGVSLEDLAAATGLMANAGIQGSVAGTGLRHALEKLQQAAGGASPEVMGLAWNQTRLVSAMQKIGATVIDARGKLLPLEQVFLRLKEGLEKLNQADQVQLSNILFGDEAGSKMLAITNQSSEAIVKMFSDMKNSAGATDVARTAMSGARLEIMQLQGTVDALGNKLGETTVIGMRPLVGAANMLASAIAGMPQPIKTTVAAIVVLAGAAAAATVGLGALNMIIGQTGGWALLASNAKMAALSIASIGGTATLIAGAAAALAVFSGAIKETDQASKSLLQTITGLSAAVATFRTLTTFKVPPFLTAILSVGAGIAAYTGIGAGIKVTNEEVAKLTDDTKALEEEIAVLQEQVAESKELGISTELAEKRIEKLSIKLQDLKGPLEIKLDLQKAEGQVAKLTNSLKTNWQLGGPGAFGGAPSNAIASKQSIPLIFPLILPSMLAKDNSLIQGLSAAVPSIYATKTGSAEEPMQLAQLKAAERLRDVYKEIESGTIESIVGEAARRDAEQVKMLGDKVNELKLKASKLPITATAERKDIDKELGFVQQKVEAFKARIRLSVNTEEIDLARVSIERQLEQTNISAEQRNTLEKALIALTNERLKLQKEEIANAEKIAQAMQRSKEQSISEIDFYKKLVEGTKNAANEQLASGKITKSQAEENIRLVQLQQIEYEKLAKLKEIASRESRGEDTASQRSQLNDINERKISLVAQQRQFIAEKELSLIQAQRSEYSALLTKRLADKSITQDQYENELRYLERIALEREKSSKQGQLKLVNPESSEGLDLRKQIADLDKSISENRLATAKAVSERIAKEVESYSQILDLASRRLDVENQAREQSKGGYEIEMQLVQAMTEQVRARQEVIKSEFAVSAAYLEGSLQSAEANLSALQEKRNRRGIGASERSFLDMAIANAETKVADIKAASAQNAIRAKEAELNGLREQERMEWRSLDLKQRMAIIDQESMYARSRFNNAQAALELRKTEAKAKDPTLSADEKKTYAEMAKIQADALNLSAKDVDFQYNKLQTLKEINRVERDTLAMNQRSRRNNAIAELVRLGGAPRFAGGDVTPSGNYTINELGRESFLSDSGQLSWINRPPFAQWRPPSRGIVIPADVSAHLASIGALPGGAGRRTGASGTALAQSIGPGNHAAMAAMKQSIAIGKLQKSIDALTRKTWDVHVTTPSNAKLLRSVGSF